MTGFDCCGFLWEERGETTTQSCSILTHLCGLPNPPLFNDASLIVYSASGGGGGGLGASSLHFTLARIKFNAAQIHSVLIPLGLSPISQPSCLSHKMLLLFSEGVDASLGWRPTLQSFWGGVLACPVYPCMSMMPSNRAIKPAPSPGAPRSH